jgi:hypothetical protein
MLRKDLFVVLICYDQQLILCIAHLFGRAKIKYKVTQNITFNEDYSNTVPISTISKI